jgi:hypothetical protein
VKKVGKVFVEIFIVKHNLFCPAELRYLRENARRTTRVTAPIRRSERWRQTRGLARRFKDRGQNEGSMVRLTGIRPMKALRQRIRKTSR